MSPRMTQPTSSSSRFSAMPIAPPGNCTISLYITAERPSIFATPSATVRIVPVFFLTALVESLAICCSICSRTVLIGSRRVARRSYQEISDGLREGRELAGDGGFVDIVPHPDAHAGDQLVVAAADGRDVAAVLLAHGGGDLTKHGVADRAGVLDLGLAAGGL